MLDLPPAVVDPGAEKGIEKNNLKWQSRNKNKIP